MESIKAIIERITFHNQENGYTVVKAKVKGYRDLVTLVGAMGAVNVGSVVTAKGAWKHDGRYGHQFEVSDYRESVPASLQGLEKYLGSGLIKGIGPVNAKRIVTTFKENTMEVLERCPEKLTEVKGIGHKRAVMIQNAWDEQKEVKHVMLFLQSHGVSTTYAVKIFKTYRNNSIKIVKENPYRLAEDIWGIGFKTADKIAANLGFTHNHPERIHAGILYVLNELAGDGHCFGTCQQIVDEGIKILDVENEALRDGLNRLVEKGKLLKTGLDQYYLPLYYRSEELVAANLSKLISQTSPFSEVKDDAIIAKMPTDVIYDDIQKKAVITAVKSKCMIMTGGPGTGKTTTTKAIISVFQSLNAKIMLCAPTGRAAKKLSETTRKEAKTIHRLLEYKPGEGFKKNEKYPLRCDVLIVDEASMLDILLTHNLIKALDSNTILILVGDVDQLPSVGPGNVLRDLIESGCVPVVRLERIFRQGKNSLIVTNAHRINQGLFPYISTKGRRDFYYMEAEEPEEIPGIIIDLCKNRLPRYFRVNPMEEIQILSPMQRGSTGTHQLNQLLQDALNPGDKRIAHGRWEYRLHDKVMQIRNNYDKNVYNGDIGKISGIDQVNRIIYISFDGTTREYQLSEMDEVTLAYAMTVHKSQGSEYPIVIAPLTTQHFVMLQRNLLYTSVTRARKAYILIGSKRAIAMAVKNDRIAERNTRLSSRTQAYCLQYQQDNPLR